MSIPHGYLYHYDINIQPDKCPQKVNHEIIDNMVQAYRKLFGTSKFIFDGHNNLYTDDPLPIGNVRMELKVTLFGKVNDRVFRVNIKWLTQVSLFALEKTLKGCMKQIPYDAILTLDVVMKHLPFMTYTPVGRSFFSSPKGDDHPFGNGREVWCGFHQTVQPSQWKMMLNLDIIDFYKVQSVIEFMYEVLDIRDIGKELKPLTDLQRTKFTKKINGLKIKTTSYGTIQKKYTVNGVTRRSAQMQFFPLKLENGQTVECTVAKYFLDKYKIKLLYSHLPCLLVGPEHKHTYLPLEVCYLVAGQFFIKQLTDMQTSTINKITAQSASDREQEINSVVQLADFNNEKEFGFTIPNSMMEVRGQVLPPIKLQYGERTLPNHINLNFQQINHQALCQNVRDMRDTQFFAGIEIHCWAIVCFAPQKTVNEDALRNFIKQLQIISSDAGMPIVNQPCFCKYAMRSDQVESIFRYLKSTFTRLQLVVVIIQEKTPVYAEVKRVGDIVLGMATQCIQAKNVNKALPKVLSSICLKINVKLGGINSIIVPNIRPKVFNEPVIFLGADVTRLNDITKLSIAAVVGSMDAHPNRYATTVRVQQHRQTIIQELGSMVRELLIMFYKSTGYKPHRIILYRNGVPKGQFLHVFGYELIAIRKACLELESSYKPGITFIMVHKRHHNRSSGTDKIEQSGNSENIPADTAVDFKITYPIKFHFYLYSHQGIQKTSNLSHYNVLWDDNNFDLNELQCLTYQLCNTFVKCTHSISIPAPAYYAHLVVLRARCHLVKKEHGSNEGTHQSGCSDDKTLDTMTQAITVHYDIKKSMYFA